VERERGSECKSCAEVILRTYFAERDKDNDGVIIDWDKVYEMVSQGVDIETAIIQNAEFLPGSWLCRYLTLNFIEEEVRKGRCIEDVLEEIRTKEPLRYRGCIMREGIIYDIEGV